MPKFVLLLRDGTGSYPNMGPEQMQAIVQRYVAWRAKVQKDGYALYGRETRYSTCAVPIFSQRRVIASLVMRFPTSALRPADIVKRYLPSLNECARAIGQAFDAYNPRGLER